MLRRISRDDICKAIDKAEVDFRSCWDVLQQVKSGLEAENFENFIQFQGVLAKAIFDLEVIYQRVAQESDKTIYRKVSFAPKWFSARMNLLKEYKVAIKRTISVGKSLGDAFAWLFYHDDRKYLQLQHQYGNPSHIPTGTGGIGEVTFIQKTQSIEGFLVLYHGITTTLRIGDFTLIDTKNRRAVAIGELKSHEIEDEVVRVDAILIGPEFNEAMKKVRPEAIALSAAPLTLSPGQRERLSRQIKKATQTFDAREQRGKQLTMQIDTHVDQLDALCRKLRVAKLAYQQVGDSLVLAAVKNRKSRLSTKMLLWSKNDTSSNLDFGNLTDEVVKIMGPKLEWNAVHISGLQYSKKGESFLLLGMIPLFWWPMDIETIRQIVFQEVQVMTLFNPAHLRHKLSQNGFEAKVSRDNGHIVELSMQIHDGSVQTIHSCTYFSWMIQHGLLTTDSVLKLIQQCKEELDQGTFSHGTKIGFDFYHCTGPENAQQQTVTQGHQQV